MHGLRKRDLLAPESPDEHRNGDVFNFDWANPSADCLVCTHCRYIHWFLPGKR